MAGVFTRLVEIGSEISEQLDIVPNQARVATAKYQDSLPLYRQAALLSHFGSDLSRN